MAQRILSYLEAESLLAVEAVSPAWAGVVRGGRVWRRLTQRRISTDTLWRHLSHNWPSLSTFLPDSFYRRLYTDTEAQIKVRSPVVRSSVLSLRVEDRGELEDREIQPPEDTVQD